MKHFKGDPRWITAKFGHCSECHTDIKNKRAYYYPNTKEIFCESCGQKHAADFNSHAQDEEMYSSYYGQRY